MTVLNITQRILLTILYMFAIKARLVVYVASHKGFIPNVLSYYLSLIYSHVCSFLLSIVPIRSQPSFFFFT
jgi:hypothetical protein